MLVCNETIAENSFWQEMPFMYRSHQEPDEDKLEKMEQFLRGFGYYLRKKDGEIHRWDLCEECYDRMTGQFRIRPDVEELVEFI